MHALSSSAGVPILTTGRICWNQATKRFFTVANVTKGSVESLQPSLVRHGNLILSSFFLWKSHFFSGSNAFSQKIMNSSKFLNIYFMTLHTVLNSTCGQRDMKWAPLRHISDLERQEMIKMTSGTLIAFTWYQNRPPGTPHGWEHQCPVGWDVRTTCPGNLYINKTLSQKTTGHRCSQPFGVVGGRFWYQVKAINVPDDILTISCLSRSEICLKGAHSMSRYVSSLWSNLLGFNFKDQSIQHTVLSPPSGLKFSS